MWLLTGANHTHARSLLQCLTSFLEHASHHPVRVYDLGLTPEQRVAVDRLGARFHFFQCRTWSHASCPQFFNINVAAGHYAWKPYLIHAALEELQDTVLWLDAGCCLTGPLDPIEAELRTHGVYSPCSLGRISTWTHPATLAALQCSPAVAQRYPNRSGGVLGCHYDHPAARRLLQTWRDRCSFRDIIAPEGSTRTNHRQDQAVLSVLWAQAVERGELSPQASRNLLNLSLQNDID